MTIVFCRAAPVCQVLERKARFQNGRCLPLLCLPAAWRVARSRQRNTPLRGLLPDPRPLGEKTAGGEDRRHRRRVVQASRPAGYQRTGLRCRITRGGALGLPQIPGLSRRCPHGCQSRRRRRHYRRNLRTDRRSVLWGRSNPGQMARKPDDDGRDHVNGRQPLRQLVPVQDAVGFHYGRRLIRNPPLRSQMAAQLNPLRIDPNHPVT